MPSNAPLSPSPSPAADLRTILVTGGGRGLGLETCRQLADQGHRVILTARNEERAADATAMLIAERAERHVRACVIDVSDAASIAAASEWLQSEVGQIDALVNNAATADDANETATSIDPDTLIDALQVNVLGAWRLSLALLPFMGRVRHGVIVNVSNEGASFGTVSAKSPALRVSKAALNALTVSLSAELRRRAILVNAVSPGSTDASGLRTLAHRARGVVWAATLPADGPTGGFFRDEKPIAW